MTHANEPTVLVVDDDADSRCLLEVALVSEGFHVVQADMGHQGLMKVMNEPVDIVLLDLMLPDISGIQCCSLMHERLGHSCPPVLMVTGLDDEASINQAFMAQATDFITKPVNLPVLVHRIRRVLRERELLKRLEDANTQLTQVSQTDSLTQIANRHHFQKVFLKEWNRLAREQNPLGLLLCDLDAFKQYNDSYGHLAGDLCLKRFAGVLVESVNRATDLVARYGGEEFIVLLPNTTQDGLETVDDRIRHLFAKVAIPHKSSWVSDWVTYSAGGVSAIPIADVKPERLIEYADNALYQAKEQGRNRSIIKHCDPI